MEMYDDSLRPISEQVLAPLGKLFERASPVAISLVGAGFGVAAAIAASQTWWLVALAAWLLNRTLDGIDGIVARAAGANTDQGGYLDITLDLFVYAMLPLGVAAGIGTTQAWMAAAFLVATFPVNTITWSYLAGLLNRRNSRTSLPMAGGLIEGAETIAFYTAMLLFPQFGVALMFVMAGLVVLGAGLRFRSGWEQLR